MKEENSNNFKIYKILYQKNFFTRNLDWFINDSYYIRTVNSIEKILNLLEKLDIDYSTLFFLFDHYKDNLKENIISLCFGRLENANNIYHKLNNIKSKIFEKKNDLNEIINFLKFFFPNSKKDEIRECTNIINQTNQFKIFQFKNENFNNKFSNILKYKEDAYKYNQLSNSLFFMTIYRENKNKLIINEDLVLINTTKEYNKLQALFENDNFKEKLNLLDIFFEELKTKNDRAFIVKREINYLKNYFNIKDLITTDLETYIIIYLSKEEIKKLFLGIQTFIEIFKLKKTNFSNLISKYIEEIDNKEVSLEINNKLSKFVKETLNLKYEYEKDEQSDIFSDCIEMLPGKEGSITFAIGKEEWEIRNLNEFIGMEENPLLQTDDILAFVKSSLFINSIFDKKKFNNNDEYIYEYFKNQLNEDNFLLKSFKDYLEKYALIENLYNEYLNKPEVSKIKILSIIKNAQIKISNFNEGESTINFICKYKSERNNKEIDITYDELNELRDRALISNPKDNLSKKYNDIDNNKENIIKNEEKAIIMDENEKKD